MQKSEIKGYKEAPYSGGLMFRNIEFQNKNEDSKKLTKLNYKNYFNVNEFVDESIFEE